MAPASRLVLGLLLTASAGFIDAVGFIQLGGYYTSFMSGNTTQAGVDLMSGVEILLPLSLVAMFLIGSFAGSVLALRDHWGPSLVLAFVLLCLAGSLFLGRLGGSVRQAMLLLAIAAGAQNAVIPFSGGARLGTTFVSGTLFGAGQDLALALAGRAPRWRWTQHLAVWLALLFGALLGTFTYAVLGAWALTVPAIVYAAMLTGFSLRQR